MKTPNPHFDREKYADLPAEYHEPRLDFSFDDLDAADDFDRETVMDLDRLWTTLTRAWDSPRTVLSAPEVVEIVDVYLNREQRLAPDEREKLDMFMAELGTLRSPDRPFTSLTGIEFEIIMILQPRARQNLSSDALVSAVLLDDEPETDADADEQDDMGGER